MISHFDHLLSQILAVVSLVCCADRLVVWRRERAIARGKLWPKREK